MSRSEGADACCDGWSHIGVLEDINVEELDFSENAAWLSPPGVVSATPLAMAGAVVAAGSSSVR